MESSEEDDEYPFIESITPQSKIDSVHQSLTEKVSFFFLFFLSFSLCFATFTELFRHLNQSITLEIVYLNWVHSDFTE